MMRETPGTWEHYFARQEEVNIHARVTDLGGMTYETWLLPRSPEGNFPPFLCKFDK
jgi:hypothetical protein